MNLTDKETKLLWLMLNNATEPGEVRNSSAALARSLRERGVQAADLCSTVRSGDALASNRENYEWCSIPWGKHKGAPFRDVPLHYLNWVLDSWEHINSPDWSSLKTNIIGFLGRNPQN